MPANKIKIHEVAKDYGVQSKVIVDLLKANTSGTKKYSTMTVIEDDEFDLVFNAANAKRNVELIRKQPTVAPEKPKNPKKHQKF